MPEYYVTSCYNEGVLLFYLICVSYDEPHIVDICSSLDFVKHSEWIVNYHVSFPSVEYFERRLNNGA